MTRRAKNTGHASAHAPDLTALLSQAVGCHQAGRLLEAEALYRAVLERQPNQFDGLHLLGLVHFQRGALEEAARHIDRALKVNPNAAIAHNSRAAVLREMRRFEQSLSSCDKAIALKPDYAEAFNNRASALVELKRSREALAAADKAIALHPGLAEAFNNRGNALKELKRLAEAVASFDRAIALKPDFPEAHNNRANVLNRLGRFDDALAACERAIALKPDLAEAFYNRGIAFDQLRRFEEAVASYDRAIALKPDYAEVYSNRGTTCLDLKRPQEALVSYARAFEIDPDLAYIRGMCLHAKLLLADWEDFAGECSLVTGAVAREIPAASPFHLLAWPSDPAHQLTCARVYIEERYASFLEPLWCRERYAHPRIRLAYLSSDFRDHPVAYLSAGLFEHHDRSRFETTAISYGPPAGGEWGERLERAFDHFIDARAMDDDEVARLIRAREIDIAIDLNGFTDGGRPEVLMRRPAPVQVNYLGFAGTLGNGAWDYIIADRHVLPEESSIHYAEQVVHLPDCFMVTDRARTIAERTPSRADCGLPDAGLVFCCFNNLYKITPDLFEVWMRLLERIDGSILWLASPGEAAADNLRRHARTHGVSPDRLVFAPKVAANADHLARLRLADLFLDTLYYNAHATTADALWAGVPVLTCAGTTFASCVAGSLLNAIGLPELVATSVSAYETVALALARDPAGLVSVRAKLAHNRESHPLFDTQSFTRHLEAAYATMHARTQRGEPPQGFAAGARAQN